MAAESSSTLLCLFLLFTFVPAEENTTSDVFNTTGAGDPTVPSELPTETDTSPQPPEPPEPTEPTEPWSSSSAPEEDRLPAEPLPESGLLAAVSPVYRLCPCDTLRNECDINCCCDRDCSTEDVSLFTDCSVRTVSGSKQLCSRDVASYSLKSRADGYSEVQSSLQKETSSDLLCIQYQNRFDGLSHPSPALPTHTNFEWLFNRFTSFLFGSDSRDEESPSERQEASGYQFGDVMLTAGDAGDGGTFWLPGPGLSSDCVDKNPAAFLKEETRRCVRRLVLERCSSLSFLSINTYTNIQLRTVVPVELTSVILQSENGTQTVMKSVDEELLWPALLEPDLCTNVVLKVVYVVQYSPAGEVGNVTVSVVLGSIRGSAVSLQQDFHLSYVPEDGGAAAVRLSGNPGYVVGLPLVAGTRTADGMSRSLDLRDSLSVLRSSGEQDCLSGRLQRSPVLFGLDSESGCTLRLEKADNCSVVSLLLLDLLRGTNDPRYVAAFGNSPLENPLDWLQVQTHSIATEAGSCSIPLSLHLEVEWTQYGSLVNPQAQIVSVREVIQTNSSSLVQLSAGSNVLPVRTSVAFVSVSGAAQPGYRATPTINAKLPFDFFFPFV